MNEDDDDEEGEVEMIENDLDERSSKRLNERKVFLSWNFLNIPVKKGK